MSVCLSLCVFACRIAGPLCGEFTGHRWIPFIEASDAELWCFFLSAHEQTVDYTIETSVMWDAIGLIMTSRQCLASGACSPSQYITILMITVPLIVDSDYQMGGRAMRKSGEKSVSLCPVSTGQVGLPAFHPAGCVCTSHWDYFRPLRCSINSFPSGLILTPEYNH